MVNELGQIKGESKIKMIFQRFVFISQITPYHHFTLAYFYIRHECLANAGIVDLRKYNGTHNYLGGLIG